MVIIVKQVYWYISQFSGERLQDHWSSSCSFITYRINVCMEKNSISSAFVLIIFVMYLEPMFVNMLFVNLNKNV